MHVLDDVSRVGHDEFMTRTVLVLGFPGVQSLDVTGPADVFTTASIALRDQGSPVTYDLRLVSQHGQPIDTGVGLRFVAHALPDPAEPVDTLLLPGGMGVHRAVDDAELIEWIREAATRARRVISVCNGAFLAAEAGLLDGRRAATHWAMAEHLAERYPTVQVDAEALFVRSSDHVWTSAGVLVGMVLVAVTGWAPLDPIVALAVGVNILVTGYGLARRALAGLLSARLPAEDLAAVDAVLAEFRQEGVEVRSVRSVESGRQRLVALEIAVPGSWTVRQAHELSDRVEAAMAAALPRCVTLVHVEPQAEDIPA